MIRMEDCIFQNEGDKHAVTFNYTEDEKSAVCGCGNSWVPSSVCDTKCKVCKETED